MKTLVVLVLGFLCLASTAQAQVGWSSAGTACVPSAATIGHHANTGAAGVKFNATDVGTIVFTCSMDRFDTGTTNWRIKLTYRDSTGTGTTAQVLGRVYMLPIESTTATVLKSLSSNASAATVNNTIVSTAFTHPFDFDTNVYFVQVTLTRAASSENVTLFSVLIEADSPM
jgi:hypothetical protein